MMPTVVMGFVKLAVPVQLRSAVLTVVVFTVVKSAVSPLKVGVDTLSAK